MCCNNYYVLSGFLCGTIPVINRQGLSNSPQSCSRGAKTLEPSIKYHWRSWNRVARASSNVISSQCWSLKSCVMPQHWHNTHCWAHRAALQGLAFGRRFRYCSCWNSTLATWAFTFHLTQSPIGASNTWSMCLIACMYVPYCLYCICL